METKKYFRLNQYIDYIIHLFLYIYLIVDMFAGYLIVTTGTSGKTQYFKLFFYALVFISIASKSHKYFTFILFCIMFLCFNYGYKMILPNIDASADMSFFVRFIIIPAMFMYYRLLLKKNNLKINTMFKQIMVFNIFVFIINFFLGLIGYGFRSYGNLEFGRKGFFHNVAELVGLMFCFFYYITSEIKHIIPKIIFYSIVICMAFIIGTKAAILSIFLFSLIDLYYTSSQKRRFFLKLFSPIIIIMIICLTVIFVPQTEFYRNFESRILPGLTRNNIIDGLLSGRITQVKKWYTVWASDINILTILFGIGYSLRHGPMEIDFFFTFYFYGIVLLAILFSFHLYLIFMSYKKSNFRLMYFNILYLMISFTSGYIFQNVMAGVFFTYINVSELFYRNNEFRFGISKLR